MRQVGITGGIGSGKSTVCKVFKTLGVPVFNADEVARELTNNDPVIAKGIVAAFGDAYYENGVLDRKRLAAFVFEHPEKLEQLNSIIHPLVGAAYEQWLTQQDAPYVIKEAAILVETGGYKSLDFLILVTAPAVLRQQRVMHRDGVSAAEVQARMKRQLPEEEKAKHAHAIIHNDEKQLLLPQVVTLHEQLVQDVGIGH